MLPQVSNEIEFCLWYLSEALPRQKEKVETQATVRIAMHTLHSHVYSGHKPMPFSD